MMDLAAVAIAIIPDEHCLSTVIPGVLTGKPAARAQWRAMFRPCVP
jgi:hypothetical protein